MNIPLSITIDYVVVHWLGDTLCAVVSQEYGRQLFTKVSLRKARSCASCSVPMAVKAAAFSPITNGYNRMHRVCTTCFRSPLSAEERA